MASPRGQPAGRTLTFAQLALQSRCSSQTASHSDVQSQLHALSSHRLPP